ncbi:MAG: methyltransferase [Wenzhouxiangella sp.]
MKSWISPLLIWRDRLLSNPDFQRWSLRAPLVSLIARRRMRALFDLCGGFVYSQVLLACTQLGLFHQLAEGPRSAADLSAQLKVPEEAMMRLLEAAQALKLVEARDQGRYGLGQLGAAMLGNPSVGMMIEHHSALYADLSDPVALMRGERPLTDLGQFWAYSRNEQPTRLRSEDIAAYSGLMAASQALIAEQVYRAYPIHRHRRLLDVGGGEGAFAGAVLRHVDALEACVFDLPPVAERARARFAEQGLEHRGTALSGNFLSDSLPQGFDLISLVRILHDHDDAAALALLCSIRRAIAPDGVLLIAEPMRDTRGAEAIGAYFGLYLMAMGQGRPRSAEEIGAMLEQAGFTTVRAHRTAAPLMVRVLSARPRLGG